MLNSAMTAPTRSQWTASLPPTGGELCLPATIVTFALIRYQPSGVPVRCPPGTDSSGRVSAGLIGHKQLHRRPVSCMPAVHATNNTPTRPVTGQTVSHPARVTSQGAQSAAPTAAQTCIQSLPVVVGTQDRAKRPQSSPIGWREHTHFRARFNVS